MPYRINQLSRLDLFAFAKGTGVAVNVCKQPRTSAVLCCFRRLPQKKAQKRLRYRRCYGTVAECPYSGTAGESSRQFFKLLNKQHVFSLFADNWC